MPLNRCRKTVIMNTICVMLVLLAGITRIYMSRKTAYSYNCIIMVLFSVAIIIWFFQLRRRLLQPYVRRNLMAAALLMIFWIAIRTIKYEFLFPREHISVRYAWYLYYIPFIFIPLLMFLSVLYIGRPYNSPISRWWNLLYIPAVMLGTGILTNDIHQSAFFFPGGFGNWNNDSYVYGPVYYGVMIWVGTLFVAMLVIALSRCAVPANRKKIWIPLLPLAFGVIYTVLYILYSDNILRLILTFPEMGCFLFAAYMESLIVVHLFPSNDKYSDFWNASSIGAGIMDMNGTIHYKSRHSVPVSQELVRRAESQDVYLEDGNIVLRSHRIHGGFCYWNKDISEINKLNRMLEDIGNVLSEENIMLEAENKIREERIRISRQNVLYDSIAGKVSPQLDIISRLLDKPADTEEEFIENMKYACILNAYVKRYSNLLLLSHQNRRIDSGELGLAITESLEYVQLYGVKTHILCDGNQMFDREKILISYELFENVLELVIPGADAILVNMNTCADGLTLSIELNTHIEIESGMIADDRIAECGGRLTVTTEQNTIYVILSLPAGGEIA